MNAPAPRICANADESTELPDGQWYIQFITEGQPGYNRSKATFDSLLMAKARATVFNHLEQRLTVDDVRTIQMSSRYAGPVKP